MRSRKRTRILMLLENNPYVQDSRVKKEAQTLVRAGYHVSVVSPKADNSDSMRDVVDGVVLYRFRPGRNTGGLLGYVWEFGYSTMVMFVLAILVWLREGVDVVHAHNPPETLFIVGAFFKLFRKKFVFDHHDVSPELYRIRYGPDARPQVERILRFLERATFATADHVIATNESHRAIAIGRGGVSPSAVTIVRNGPGAVDMSQIVEDPELRARAGTILGYVGVMGPQDGVDYLLRAMAHLIDDLGVDDVFCVLIGKGDSIPDLKRLADELGIADRVEFTGWVSDEATLFRYLATVDICVDPDPSNPYNDLCTMIKMMEYMAAGKPIVAFDLPEHRVSAADAAIYAEGNDECDMARKIRDLIEDPARRAQLGAVGRERVQRKLGWEHQEIKLLDVYSSLTGTTRIGE